VRCHGSIESHAFRSLVFEQCRRSASLVPWWTLHRSGVSEDVVAWVSSQSAMESDECLSKMSSKSFLAQPTTARAICFEHSRLMQLRTKTEVSRRPHPSSLPLSTRLLLSHSHLHLLPYRKPRTTSSRIPTAKSCIWTTKHQQADDHPKQPHTTHILTPRITTMAPKGLLAIVRKSGHYRPFAEPVPSLLPFRPVNHPS